MRLKKTILPNSKAPAHRARRKKPGGTAPGSPSPPHGTAPEFFSDFFTDLASWRAHFKVLLVFFGFTFSFLPLLAGETQASEPDYASTQADLASFIRHGMAKDHVKALSIALVDGDRVVWQEGFGLADEKNNLPATADTLYRLDSATKILTAVEILRLKGQGRLALDEPLSQALPGFFIQSRFKHAKSITLRSLLAHHSGLPADYHQGMWVENPGTLAQLVEDLKQDYLVAPPQSFYKYSDLDYSLLGRVIELKTRRAFAQTMREDLLEPLGMDSSTFDPDPAVQGRMAKGYRQGRETAPLNLRDIPAGGLVSSAGDMAKFIRFLFTGKPSLLGSKSLDSMYREQYAGLPLDFGNHIGLGWMLNGEDLSGGLAYHDGDYNPYFCRVAVLPREKLGVVVLSNTSESHVMGRETAIRALKLMRQAKFGVPAGLAPTKVPMPRLITVPGEKLAGYVGSYSGVGTAAVITRDGSHLRGDLMGHSFDLVPTSENNFIPRVMILFFPIHLPEYTIEFTTIQDKDLIILGGLGSPVVFEKIRPVPLPPAWKEWLGNYQLVDPDGATQFKGMTLEEKDGLLTFNARITSRVFDVTDTAYRIALEPLSNDDAVVSGLVFPDGDTVHISRKDGRIQLYYAGLRFTKLDAPGCCPGNNLASR